MANRCDLLIAGAGPVGCVIAERAARLLGWNVVIVERRAHLAGNCHDSHHTSGVLIQNYGPHYFRTNSPGLVRYLSRFTDWIPGNYVVRSEYRGQHYDMPINLNTLERFFGLALDAKSAEQLLMSRRVSIPRPTNSEELVLSKLGRELYEAFYLPYTRKQWGMEPRELSPSVCGRLPVRYDRDHRYVDHAFQCMPKRGFTALFENMIDHPRIRVRLESDFLEERRALAPRRATVYSGPIDGYFHHRYGPLPYRSLRFDYRVEDTPWAQPCVQINYPDERPWTRSVEFKHVTGQDHPRTVVSFETPAATGEPFYPIPCPENLALYRRYAADARREEIERKVYFCGRLATYRYLNTDEVIQSALGCFRRIARRAAGRTRQPA